MSLTKIVPKKSYSSIKKIRIIFLHRKLTLNVRILTFLTTFFQQTTRLKNFLRSWLLILGLKEGLVKCATLLCVKCWVILTNRLYIPQLETWQLLFPYCTLKTIAEAIFSFNLKKVLTPKLADFIVKSKMKIRISNLDLEL